jgi:hypothetical protein
MRPFFVYSIRYIGSYICAVGIVLLAGCDNESGTISKVERNMAPVDLRERHSAYAGTSADWTSFMDCWRGTALEQHARQSDGGREHETVLGRQSVDGPAGVSETQVRSDLARLESRLNLELPKSYKDFWIAYKLSRSYRSDSTRGTGAAPLECWSLIRWGTSET